MPSLHPSKLQVSWQPLRLELHQPFAIAHGVSSVRQNVLVYVGGGIGEAAGVPYLGETEQGITDYLRQIDWRDAADPLLLVDLIDALPAGSAAARAALDIALHDAWGRALGQPLYRLLGLNPERIAPTSVTIPLASPSQMAESARRSDAPALKIKLGVDADELRFGAVRRATAARLRVDANGGWTRERAEQLLPLFAEAEVELVEQPLPPGDLEGLRALSRVRSRPRIFVDESIKTSADILAHHGLVDGVVIKLAKSGGIRGALQQISLARALGLEVMLGCMIESSVAVTAAAHLAPLAQWVDLDAPLLIDNDPFEGVRYQRGRLILPEGPGLGVRPRGVPSISPKSAGQ
jgi:L-alanine-DL-glutamate epimerase-like enolase superfamily enzyme